MYIIEQIKNETIRRAMNWGLSREFAMLYINADDEDIGIVLALGA